MRDPVVWRSVSPVPACPLFYESSSRSCSLLLFTTNALNFCSYGSVACALQNEEYAVQIARDWNARDGKSGYVTRFQIQTSFLKRYEVHQVGSAIHQEYWIPAEELEEWNNNIVGKIAVIAEFHST